MRAFGCLLEELLERSIVTVDGQNTLKILGDLQADCAQEKISNRPLFAEIVEKLNALRSQLANHAHPSNFCDLFKT